MKLVIQSVCGSPWSAVTTWWTYGILNHIWFEPDGYSKGKITVDLNLNTALNRSQAMVGVSDLA